MQTGAIRVSWLSGQPEPHIKRIPAAEAQGSRHDQLKELSLVSPPDVIIWEAHADTSTGVIDAYLNFHYPKRKSGFHLRWANGKFYNGACETENPKPLRHSQVEELTGMMVPWANLHKITPRCMTLATVNMEAGEPEWVRVHVEMFCCDMQNPDAILGIQGLPTLLALTLGETVS